MKALEEIIEILKDCSGPSCHVDFQIAQHLGWKENSSRASRSGDSKTAWLNPETSQPGKVPTFTKEVQHAFRLIQYICPEYAGALVRTPNKVVMQFENYEKVEAATIPLAMCQAALMVLAVRSPSQISIGKEMSPSLVGKK